MKDKEISIIYNLFSSLENVFRWLLDHLTSKPQMRNEKMIIFKIVQKLWHGDSCLQVVRVAYNLEKRSNSIYYQKVCKSILNIVIFYLLILKTIGKALWYTLNIFIIKLWNIFMFQFISIILILNKFCCTFIIPTQFVSYF